jgi:hypothetical protein
MLPPSGEETPEKLNLEVINAGFAIESASDDSDDCTTLEQLDILKRREEVRSHVQDREERKEHAHNIFVLTCSWVCAIYLLLLFQGFQYSGFRLSDSVMLAAIGSTTANIVGVFIIVVRYIFPKK